MHRLKGQSYLLFTATFCQRESDLCHFQKGDCNACVSINVFINLPSNFPQFLTEINRNKYKAEEEEELSLI